MSEPTRPTREPASHQAPLPIDGATIIAPARPVYDPSTSAPDDSIEAIHGIARDKGWWDNAANTPRPELIASKLMLIVSELSEALEEMRTGHPTNSIRIENHKPEGFLVELADAEIRLRDLLGFLGLTDYSWSTIVSDKVRYNKTRAQRHGGKAL